MSKIIDSLKELGFNTYEAKVYLALLKKYPATGYEVSKLAEIPQSRTYDTLNALAQQGIVSAIAGKPTTYVPIKPKELTKQYKKKLTQNIDFLEKNLPDVQTKYFEPVMPITERKNIYSKILEMIKSAKEKIYLEIWAKEFKHFENELLDAYNRNVEIRIVSYEKLDISFGLVYEHPFAKKIESFLEGRHIALVVDRKEVLYGEIASAKENNENVIWTKNHAVVYLMEEFITHDMMLLDIQNNFPKELVYTYGTGLKRLHDKILGADNIFTINK